MRTRIQRKLLSAAVILTAVGMTICVASYLDRLLPQSSVAWLILIEILALGSMLGVSWASDELDAYFERRTKRHDHGDPRGAHRNGQVNESWQFDPLDELRAVVHRANLQPRPIRDLRWSPTRAWRGQ